MSVEGPHSTLDTRHSSLISRQARAAAGMRLMTTTPTSTSAEPAICSGVITSSSPSQPKAIVVTGPGAPMMATVLAPVRCSAAPQAVEIR